MGNPRELLIELIGEERTVQYYEGLPIEIEAENCKYTIERKRGYADIVRTRKVRVSDFDFFSNHGISIVGNYVGPQPNPEPRPQPQQLEERFHTRTDSGRIRAWNIDDAVATFIVAARNGKVNWACGNIDVRLPANMPPKDLGPFTFIKRGFQTALYGIMVAIDKIKTIALTGTTGEAAIIILGWWGLNIIIGGLIIVAAPEIDGKTILHPLFDTYFGFTIINAIPLYILLFFTKYYSIWRTGWEVKMK